ncbi:EamA family transporter [Streptomyces longispororuber]|uniref:EamA family transporter n=1 Tax=Streptomyces longispororuber TaxID=68230 RepID=UPI00340B6486
MPAPGVVRRRARGPGPGAGGGAPGPRRVAEAVPERRRWAGDRPGTSPAGWGPVRTVGGGRGGRLSRVGGWPGAGPPRRCWRSALVALLSSLIPYCLDLLALRRVGVRAFGVLLALGPAVGAAVGFAALGERLSGPQCGAVGLVVAACAWAVWSGSGGPAPGPADCPADRLADCLADRPVEQGPAGPRGRRVHDGAMTRTRGSAR